MGLPLTCWQLPEVVVGEDEDLEAGEHRHVIRDLGELVGAEVELDDVQPCADINGERRQLIFLKVKLVRTVLITKIRKTVHTVGIISFSKYRHFTQPSDGIPKQNAETRFKTVQDTGIMCSMDYLHI